MSTKPPDNQVVADLLNDLISVTRDALIANLCIAGVSQHHVRQIAGVNMNRVGRIAKLLKEGGKVRK